MPVNEKSLLSLPRQRSIARIIHRLNERPWLGSVRLLILIKEVHLGNLLRWEDRQRLQIELLKATLPESLHAHWHYPLFFLAAVCWTVVQVFNNCWEFIVCLWEAGHVLRNGLNVVWMCMCEWVYQRERERERESKREEEELSSWLLLSPLVLIMFFVEWTKEE